MSLTSYMTGKYLRSTLDVGRCKRDGIEGEAGSINYGVRRWKSSTGRTGKKKNLDELDCAFDGNGDQMFYTQRGPLK